ncbi:hypothetical protein [Halarchaeum salinum]|uniref:Uncharacterized protein n=1 Tax=Halarchaeum salinum TaxID=489912 RepID=A0AAV3S9Q4_9EURY
MIGDFDGGVPPEPDGFDVENEYETIKEVAGKITIDNTSIPIINEGAKTELRKGNAVDLKRQTTVHFPAQGLGSEWINLFGIFGGGDRPSNLREFAKVGQSVNGMNVGMSASMGGGGSGAYVKYNQQTTYEVNATNRQSANRAVDTLEYQQTYSSGKDSDKKFS